MAQIDLGQVKELGLPRVGHISFIVNDMASTLPGYGSLYGIRTWYRTILEQNAVQYGQRHYDADWDFVYGYSGKLQMELIDLRGDRDNIFGEFLEERGPGLQHLGFYLTDLDETVARAKDAGIRPVQTGDLRIKGGFRGRAVFLDARPTCGTMLELIELKAGGLTLPSSWRWLMEVGVLLGNGEKIRL